MPSTNMFYKIRASLISPKLPVIEDTDRSEEEQEADEKRIQKSISEAVSAVVDKEEFQKALAVRLAAELQPSLSALDSSNYVSNLQVSTNKITQQLDAHDTKITHLSTLLSSSDSNTSERITAIESAVAKISTSLGELENCIKGFESQQATKFANITSDLDTVKEITATSVGNLSVEISSAKEGLSENIACNFSALNDRVTSVEAAIENEATSISNLKDSDASSNILSSIQSSTDIQSAQSATLEELRAPVLEIASLKSQVTAISTYLTSFQSQFDSLNEILAETKASNASHSSHSKVLDDLSTTNPGILDAVKGTQRDVSAQNNILSELHSALSDGIATAAELSKVSTSIDNISSAVAAQVESIMDIKTDSELNIMVILKGIHELV
ncbi:hypothetical protein BGT96224_A20931 [Blumeria graminis f. sp. tritici 96224]|nr:hypothetical protein BGT96224_A20931 [Blumeria graminis f. sp. tritici 96224]